MGRRWNRDPNKNVWESDYSVMGGNPVNNTDILGDKWINGEAGNLKEKDVNLNQAKQSLNEASTGLQKAKSDGADNKKIKKLTREFNNAERIVKKAEKEYNEVKANYDLIDGVMKHLDKENHEWYNYWDQMVIADEPVNITLKSDPFIRTDEGRNTDEAIEASRTPIGGYQASVRLDIPGGFSIKDIKEAAETIVSRSKVTAHALGHFYLVLDTKKKYEKNREEWMVNSYSDDVFNKLPVKTINRNIKSKE